MSGSKAEKKRDGDNDDIMDSDSSSNEDDILDLNKTDDDDNEASTSKDKGKHSEVEAVAKKNIEKDSLKRKCDTTNKKGNNSVSKKKNKRCLTPETEKGAVATGSRGYVVFCPTLPDVVDVLEQNQTTSHATNDPSTERGEGYRIVNEIYQYLEDVIDAGKMVGMMFQKGVFDHDVMEKVHVQETHRKKNCLFMQHLLQKLLHDEGEVYSAFIEALTYAKCKQALEKLPKTSYE